MCCFHIMTAIVHPYVFGKECQTTADSGSVWSGVSCHRHVWRATLKCGNYDLVWTFLSWEYEGLGPGVLWEGHWQGIGYNMIKANNYQQMGPCPIQEEVGQELWLIGSKYKPSYKPVSLRCCYHQIVWCRIICFLMHLFLKWLLHLSWLIRSRQKLQITMLLLAADM